MATETLMNLRSGANRACPSNRATLITSATARVNSAHLRTALAWANSLSTIRCLELLTRSSRRLIQWNNLRPQHSISNKLYLQVVLMKYRRTTIRLSSLIIKNHSITFSFKMRIWWTSKTHRWRFSSSSSLRIASIKLLNQHETMFNNNSNRFTISSPTPSITFNSH